MAHFDEILSPSLGLGRSPMNPGKPGARTSQNVPIRCPRRAIPSGEFYPTPGYAARASCQRNVLLPNRTVSGKGRKYLCAAVDRLRKTGNKIIRIPHFLKKFLRIVYSLDSDFRSLFMVNIFAEAWTGLPPFFLNCHDSRVYITNGHSLW